MQPVKKFGVTTPFGKPGSWIAGYHTGQDYACPVGTWVRNTKRGRVKEVGFNKDYGNYVVVSSWHKGRFIRHLYAHLSKQHVKVGERVRNGQLLGFSGNTGNSTGPHVHYEERIRPYGYWNHIRPVLPNWEPK